MTIEQIASLIRSNISNGLKEVGNYQYPIEGIMDEVSNVRSSIIENITKGDKTSIRLSGASLDINNYAQLIPNIPVEMKTFGVSGQGELVAHCRIWKLAETFDNKGLIYFGTPDMSLNFKTYFDIDGLNSHKYSRVISNRPFVYIESAHDYEGMMDAWVFNLPPGVTSVTDKSVKADPVKILNSDGIFGNDEEFPAPAATQDKIIHILSERYIRYYRQLNHPSDSNTGTNPT